MDLIIPQWFSKQNDILTYHEIKEKLEYEEAHLYALNNEIQHTNMRIRELQRELDANS